MQFLLYRRYLNLTPYKKDMIFLGRQVLVCKKKRAMKTWNTTLGQNKTERTLIWACPGQLDANDDVIKEAGRERCAAVAPRSSSILRRGRMRRSAGRRRGWLTRHHSFPTTRAAALEELRYGRFAPPHLEAHSQLFRSDGSRSRVACFSK
jgi:hypothetical protein